mmetsp:Transcript_13495/g.23935  ORF Transcript_13495/g.23935 Transcript_13495/m.23935 type:complete len:262 (+) Transcript_13495:858-1643(+)
MDILLLTREVHLGAHKPLHLLLWRQPLDDVISLVLSQRGATLLPRHLLNHEVAAHELCKALQLELVALRQTSGCHRPEARNGEQHLRNAHKRSVVIRLRGTDWVVLVLHGDGGSADDHEERCWGVALAENMLFLAENAVNGVRQDLLVEHIAAHVVEHVVVVHQILGLGHVVGVPAPQRQPRGLPDDCSRQQVIVLLLDEATLKEVLHKLSLPSQHGQRDQLRLHGANDLRERVTQSFDKLDSLLAPIRTLLKNNLDRIER